MKGANRAGAGGVGLGLVAFFRDIGLRRLMIQGFGFGASVFGEKRRGNGQWGFPV